MFLPGHTWLLNTAAHIIPQPFLCSPFCSAAVIHSSSGPDGIQFTFSDCALSTSGTSCRKGQIPFLVYKMQIVQVPTKLKMFSFSVQNDETKKRLLVGLLRKLKHNKKTFVFKLFLQDIQETDNNEKYETVALQLTEIVSTAFYKTLEQCEPNFEFIEFLRRWMIRMKSCLHVFKWVF